METYKFVGKYKQFYLTEKVKQNANCPDSEKVGEGPGSCGGNKTSGPKQKAQKVLTKDEAQKHFLKNGNASKDFRMQRGNTVIQYRKGNKYPSDVETTYDINGQSVQVLHPGHDDRDSSTMVVKSPTKSATIVVNNEPGSKQSATVTMDNGKSRTFTGSLPVSAARSYSMNYVSNGDPFDIKDIIDKHGSSPALDSVKQLITNKIYDLAKYANNPITPESGRKAHEEISLLGDLFGFDENDWKPIREKVNKK